MKGKINIFRNGMYKEDNLRIEIEDDNSGYRVIQIKVNLDDMMRALTGFSCQDCEIEYFAAPKAYARLGKKKETKVIEMELPEGINSKYGNEEKIKDLINLYLLEHYPDWEIWCNGMKVQQNKRGFHRIVICRYVDVE